MIKRKHDQGPAYQGPFHWRNEYGEAAISGGEVEGWLEHHYATQGKTMVHDGRQWWARFPANNPEKGVS